MRAGYDLLNGLKKLRHDRLINVVVLLSFLLGFLFPILVFGIGNGMIHSLSLSLPLRPGRTGLFETRFHPMDTDAFLRENPQFQLVVKDDFPQNAVISGPTSVLLQCKVYGKAPNWGRIWPNRVYAGRDFTEKELETGGAVCVVSLDLLNKVGKIGDTISLNGVPLKIIGAEETSAKLLPNFVKLSFPMMETMFPDIDYFYDCLMKQGYTFQEDGYEACAKVVSGLGLDPNVHVVVLAEAKKDDLANYYLFTAIFMGVVSLILLYSLLNIACVLMDKLEKEKRDYQTQFRLGARKGDVFLNLFTQLFLLGAVAVAVDLAGVWLFQKLGGRVASFPLALDGAVAAEMAVLMALCIALVSWRILRPTVRSFYPKRPGAGKRGGPPR